MIEDAKPKKRTPKDQEERKLLIWGSLCISALGLIAFLITREVAVIIAMNTPILAIIGRDFLGR